MNCGFSMKFAGLLSKWAATEWHGLDMQNTMLTEPSLRWLDMDMRTAIWKKSMSHGKTPTEGEGLWGLVFAWAFPLLYAMRSINWNLPLGERKRSHGDMLP